MKFSEIKSLARSHGACASAMEAIRPMKSLKEFFAHPRAAQWSYWYACEVVKGRWPEAEATIAKSADWACWYAREVVKGRWPEAETTIAKDADCACWYAREVVKGRWPEAEATIAKDADWACWYARDVLRHPDPASWRAR